ncbi:MAG TPA: carboxyl transferase domain-containing protein, partial [Polyangiales bacterium]|nr:carboxyl transferase domain-containing protein [Polyangiales bacterium]
MSGETFTENARFMNEYVARVRQIEARMRATEEKFLPTARKRGKLLPRERLALLLDRGAPFVELHALAGYQMYSDADGSLAGGNLIAGIGFVSGRRCLVIVWNYAIKGGTVSRV